MIFSMKNNKILNRIIIIITITKMIHWIKKEKEISNFNKLDNKLKNTAFLKKASEEIIKKFKKQSTDIKSSIDKIDQIIDTIK